jgi:hypothetical protein
METAIDRASTVSKGVAMISLTLSWFGNFPFLKKIWAMLNT